MFHFVLQMTINEKRHNIKHHRGFPFFSVGAYNQKTEAMTMSRRDEEKFNAVLLLQKIKMFFLSETLKEEHFGKQR